MIQGAGQLEMGPDGQILKRPECGTPNCEKDAWIFYAGAWRCGDCVNLLVMGQKKKQVEELAAQKAAADKFIMEEAGR